MQTDLGQLVKRNEEIVTKRTIHRANLETINKELEALDAEYIVIQKQIEAEVKRLDSSGKRRTSSVAESIVSDEIRKIKFFKNATMIISDYERCMTVREVVNEIKKRNHVPDSPIIDRFILNKVSNELRAKAILKRGVNRVKEEGEYYYGLTEYFDANGIVLPQCLIF